MSGLTKIVIPKSVRSIEHFAFDGCKQLSSFSFEEGSQISSIGSNVFHDTQLKREDVPYPSTLKSNGSEWW